MPTKSTRKRRPRKSVRDWGPPKPYDGFPLTPHVNGRWQKKINGRIHYFGKWGKVVNGKVVAIQPDGCWQDALQIFKAQADDLYAGRTPRKENGDGLTVAELCNRFLTVKLRLLEAGELSAVMFGDYRSTTDRLVSTFSKQRLVDDLASDDFEALRDTLAQQYGPTRLGNEVQKIRTVFRYCYEAGLTDKPTRFGPAFKKPSASVMRRHRAKNGNRMLEAEECRKLIDAAPVQLKCMLLLALNGGFGNNDCAMLPLSALDLEKAWIDFPRPKSGIERRFPLWPETIAALQNVLAQRPQPRTDDAADKAFVTSRGRPWLSRGSANPVSVAARKLMQAMGIHRERVGFYSLRHVHRTVSDGARDPVAANLMMGHADHTMAGVYREHIDDARLEAVAEHVRGWLFE